MRLVLAGTPDAAVPSLLALLGSRHEVAAVVTRPDARAGRGRTLEPSPVKRVALEHDLEVLTPPTPRDPDFLDRLGAAVAGLLPGGGVRRPRAPGRARRAAARLGQPPLLVAARVARSRAGAARRHGGRRRHGRHDVPPRGGPRHRARARHAHRGGAARRHRRLAARPAGRRRCRAARRDDGRPRRRFRARGAAAVRRRQPRAQADDRRGAGALGAAGARRRPARAGLHPGTRRLDHRRGERVKLGPVALVRPGSEPGGAGLAGPDRVMAARDPVVLAPGEVLVGKRTVLVGTGSTPVELGEVRPSGRKPMAAADWARGIRISSGERLGG